jgi:microcystin-dependent protein
MTDMYMGQIVMFGGNFQIRDYAFCSGQLIAISQNQALFSILGTTFGGDGRTTFGLPDMRGRAPVHAGAGPGLSDRRLGQRYGVETVTLNELQLPSHTHGASFTPSGGGGTFQATTSPGLDAQPGDGSFLASGKDAQGNDVKMYRTSAPPPTRVNLGGLNVTGGGDVTVQPTGGSQGVEVSAPRAGVNFEMVMQGLYPPRN